MWRTDDCIIRATGGDLINTLCSGALGFDVCGAIVSAPTYLLDWEKQARVSILSYCGLTATKSRSLTTGGLLWKKRSLQREVMFLDINLT
jgi:hypothetical protein